MSNSLVPTDPEKNDAYTRIVKFMSNEESGILLSAKEEQILARWIYCNGLLKERKFTTEDIVDKIKAKFSVSVITARNDISFTRSLFVSLVKDLKKYTLIHHIEDITLEIQKRKTDKAYAPFLHRLYDSLTKALIALPDETGHTDPVAPVVIFNLAPGKDITPMNLKEALDAADSIIEMEKNHEYTDFENLSDEPKS